MARILFRAILPFPILICPLLLGSPKPQGLQKSLFLDRASNPAVISSTPPWGLLAPLLTPQEPVSDGITQAMRVAWGRVAQCETGTNWGMQGPTYSGALGILNANWAKYGGLQYAPNAGMASEDQQILVAQRIQQNPPDQYGCQGSW